jgi:hypothetical protein
VIYAGNATRAIAIEHASTDFDVAESRSCTIRSNYFGTTKQNSSHTIQGIRGAGSVDLTINSNWFDGTYSSHVKLQQSASWPTSHEISAATYGGLTAGQQASVWLNAGRYFVAHRCLGMNVTSNTAKAASFSISSDTQPYHPTGLGLTPTTTSIVAPATRGYLATGNTAVSTGSPGWLYGYLNLP